MLRRNDPRRRMSPTTKVEGFLFVFSLTSDDGLLDFAYSVGDPSIANTVCAS